MSNSENSKSMNSSDLNEDDTPKDNNKNVISINGKNEEEIFGKRNNLLIPTNENEENISFSNNRSKIKINGIEKEEINKSIGQENMLSMNYLSINKQENAYNNSFLTLNQNQNDNSKLSNSILSNNISFNNLPIYSKKNTKTSNEINTIININNSNAKNKNINFNEMNKIDKNIKNEANINNMNNINTSLIMDKLSQNSTSLNNNTSNNLIQPQISFLSPEKRGLLKQKFKEAQKKILDNKNKFEESIKHAIIDNNLNSIKQLMLNKENQYLFKRELENPEHLNQMLKQNRMEILLEVLKDPFYNFDGTYVFEFLSKKLIEKHKLADDMDNVSQFISNVVNYNLYRKSLTKVLGWFIISFGFFDSFLNLVKENKKDYQLEYIQFNHFETEEDICNYFEDANNYKKILIECLKEKLENLAIELIEYKGNLENSIVIDSAVKYNSKIFLKYIWETTNQKDTKINSFFKNKMNESKNKNNNNNNNNNNINNCSNIENNYINKEGKKTHMLTIVESIMNRTIFNQGKTVFKISELIDKIYSKGNTELINEIVTTWKYLNKDKDLLEKLFKKKAYDEISILLYRFPNNPNWKFTAKNFEEIIQNKGLELILLCLQEQDCKRILEDSKIQETIINNYLSSGATLYYGAEMLSHIKRTSLDLSLSIDLLNTIEKTLKNKGILDCHSPILTCLLLSEIVSNIGEISVHFHTKCEKTREELMMFCKHVHEANSNEKYIKFLLGQKDSKGRSAYQIAAEINAFMVLESPEVGTIVNKMWVGRLRHDGILAFSCLKGFLDSPSSNGSNPFLSFEKMDKSKTYFHQLCLWEESCSLRYYPESISTILLILLYNLFIYFLVINDNIMKNVNELSHSMQIMLACYITWVFCIVLNIPLQILFCKLSKKRKYQMDGWGYVELCLLVLSLMILIDPQKLFPSHDEFGNVVPSDAKSDVAFIVRATILSLNDIFVWLRITGILLTYKELGPLIRMIYLLSIVTGKYLLIYLILMIACATVYTTLFYKASPLYESYSVTFTTLFQGYLNNGDCFNFTYYKMFGAILCVGFITVGGLILVNILIALLSNEYTELSKVVDAAHRSVLLNYYKRYKWDKNYGYLALLTTPLNIINFLVLPINFLFSKTKKDENNLNNDYSNNENLIESNRNHSSNNDLCKSNCSVENSKRSCGKSNTSYVSSNEEIKDNRKKYKTVNENQEYFNEIISKLYFSIFYFPIIFLIDAFLSIFLIPFCYFVGIYVSIFEYYNQKGNGIMKQLLIIVSWIILGIPFLIINYLGDLIDLFRTVFINIDINSYDLEKKRIKQFLRPDDIRTFIHFIHKREKTEQNDLHSLFVDYLEFEQMKIDENDKDLKKQSLYYHKLKNASKTLTKKNFALSSIYSSQKFQNNMGMNEQIAKRNLLIIEILENFLIDDESDNFIVDIEKMKMLLPKTMNINNAYIKRLVYTDINTLNKAMNKRKNKANAFVQHKLLSKFVGSIVRLDKIIDAGDNTDPLLTEEAKKKNKFDIDENEDDFYPKLEELLKNIGDEVKENIKQMEKKIKEEENKIKISKNSFKFDNPASGE